MSNKTFYRNIFIRIFTSMTRGNLTLQLPEGREVVFGSGEDGVCTHIKIIKEDFFKKCILFGDIGFGESYVDGDWETKDITKVIRWMIENVEHHPTLMDDQKKKSSVNWMKFANNILSFFRRNSKLGSQKNIASHYDLSNDFFGLFLDPTMTYSSAYFKSPQQSLEDAQLEKYDQLCRKLRLKETDHLLEIGSGWGGMAIYAAKNFGCRVTTITISKKQYEFAQNRIKVEGLDSRIDLLLKDYRDLEGQFDKIVSIEMIEAVGHEYYRNYFDQCQKLLKKNGLIAIQGILCPDHRYKSFRKNMDWIQKYIFPGSLLPSYQEIQRKINQTGLLNLLDYEDMTPFYAKTLYLWKIKFFKQIDQVKSLGFDERFIRMWDYYLSYCEAAFATRNIYVAQMVFSRSNNEGL